jgi:hypothetical protein
MGKKQHSSMKQLHVWITEADLNFLLERSAAFNESVSTVVRQIIRLHRRNQQPQDQPATTADRSESS